MDRREFTEHIDIEDGGGCVEAWEAMSEALDEDDEDDEE